MKKIAVWAALLLAISGLSEATAGAPMPENVGIFLSDFGPVFTDSSGMTLYTSGRDVRRGVSECNDTRMTVGLMGDTTFKYPLRISTNVRLVPRNGRRSSPHPMPKRPESGR